MCLQNRCYVLYSCPLASILGALFMPFTSSCLLFLCLLPALTTESTLGFWIGRKILFSKCTYWFSIPMESLTLYFLHSTSPPPPYYGCQTCTFTWDTRNNKSGGKKKIKQQQCSCFCPSPHFLLPEYLLALSLGSETLSGQKQKEGQAAPSAFICSITVTEDSVHHCKPCTNPMNFSSLAHSNAAILT